MGSSSDGSGFRGDGIYSGSVWPGYKDMSPPTKELMKLTLEKKMAHAGNPPLRWMLDNVSL